MNPAGRLSVALVVGLVLWLPSLTASLDGRIDLATAATRFLIAFVFARLAVGSVAWLFQAYSTGTGRSGAGHADTQAIRRADDVASSAGASS